MTDPTCQLFTQDEIAKYQGAPVKPGEKAAMGTGCAWTTTADDGSTLIQILEERYAEFPTNAPTYKAMPELGEKGYVVEELAGYGSAIMKNGVYLGVNISGPTATEAMTVAFMKEVAARHK